jgi:putative transposase
MAYVKIWIHLVFGTRNKTHYLTPDVKRELIDHILQNAKSKGIFLASINGETDHLHCLISLGREQNIADVAKLIKGESSHWMNSCKKTYNKFEWAQEYFAVSIGESQVDAIKRYIENQEEHHRKKSFMEEHQEFMHRYGFAELD